MTYILAGKNILLLKKKKSFAQKIKRYTFAQKMFSIKLLYSFLDTFAQKKKKMRCSLFWFDVILRFFFNGKILNTHWCTQIEKVQIAYIFNQLLDLCISERSVSCSKKIFSITDLKRKRSDPFSIDHYLARLNLQHKIL